MGNSIQLPFNQNAIDPSQDQDQNTTANLPFNLNALTSPPSNPQTDPIGAQINQSRSNYANSQLLDLYQNSLMPGAQTQYIEAQMAKTFGTGKKGIAAKLLLGLLGNVPNQMRDRYAQEYQLYQKGIQNAIETQRVQAQMQLAQMTNDRTIGIAQAKLGEDAWKAQLRDNLGQATLGVKESLAESKKLSDETKRKLDDAITQYQLMKNQQYQMTGGLPGTSPMGQAEFLQHLDPQTAQAIFGNIEALQYINNKFKALARPGYETKTTPDAYGNRFTSRMPVPPINNIPQPPITAGGTVVQPQQQGAPAPAQPPQQGAPAPAQSQQPPPQPPVSQQVLQSRPVAQTDTNSLNSGQTPPQQPNQNPTIPDVNINTPGISPGAISPTKTKSPNIINQLQNRRGGTTLRGASSPSYGSTPQSAQSESNANPMGSDPDVQNELKGEYGLKTLQDFIKDYHNSPLAARLYQSYFSKQIPSAQMRANGQLKLGALDNTIQLASDFYDLLPQLNSVSERAKLALVNQLHDPHLMNISNWADYIGKNLLAQNLNPQEVQLLAKYASLAEHINTLRGPLGATGFRSIESYANLIRQGGSLSQPPEVTRELMDNTIKALLTQRKVQAKIGSGNLDGNLPINKTGINDRYIIKSYIQAAHGDKQKATQMMREDGYR